MLLATFAVLALKSYLLLGAGFAVWFASRGARRLDPAAGGGSIGFRLLLLPGATLMWPLLVSRLVRGGPAPPEEQTEHRVRGRRAAQ